MDGSTGPDAEIIGAWALHAGDRIAMPIPGGGTISAEVTEIITTPGEPGETDAAQEPGETDAAVHELSWSAEDIEACGRLTYSPSDLVTRLSANRVAAA